MTASTTSEIYIGLMSGTSLDGIDIAIVDFAQHPPTIIYQASESYSPALKQSIREVTLNEDASINALCQLDIELGYAYADLINRSLVKAGLNATDIRAIGCHGQTIRHCPNAKPPYTLQIGDPNTISSRTGITTVADFRRKDIALGGQGAPLAPAFHHFMFHSKNRNRAIINIGGIANITFLPRGNDHSIRGFDTGPGNTLLDYWISQRKKSAYDDCGEWARGGRVIDTLLNAMLKNETYFKQPFPKSTGTDYFNQKWLQPYLQPSFSAQDVQATLVELTVSSIALNLAMLPVTIDECFICGGGARNDYLMHRLQQALPNCPISSTDNLGMDPDYVEAIAFAWLARQSVNLRHGNLPTVTHANAEAILGGIYH